MEQLNLFDAPERQALTIPKDLVTPLESTKGLKTKEFKKQQQRWHEYVKTIQEAKGYNWFKARETALKHRESGEPIEI